MLFENISVILKLVCTISVIVLTDEYHSPFFFLQERARPKLLKTATWDWLGILKIGTFL